jgi:hypothetical protein
MGQRKGSGNFKKIKNQPTLRKIKKEKAGRIIYKKKDVNSLQPDGFSLEFSSFDKTCS